MKTQTPLQIQGINESLYGGFWRRLGANLLDYIFMMPVILLVWYSTNHFGVGSIINLLILRCSLL